MDENETNKTTKTFLTTGQVARLIGVSSYWITILVKKGELDTHRIGGKGWHRVSVRSLIRYAERNDVKLDWSLLENSTR